VTEEEKGTKRSIYGALGANALIAISKFIAGGISGSSAMLAEGAHSVADTVNQIFLLISLPLSNRSPDPEHPYGYGQERFFWSFVVAVGLFIAGAVFSFYEGVMKIAGEAEDPGSYLIAYIVLGAAFVFEGVALIITIREFLRTAREENRSFWDHFKTTRNTTMKVPLYEDMAALVGLLIAAGGLFVTQSTGDTVYDGIASMGIGVVLSIVAFQLGSDSRSLLIGAAAPEEDRQRVYETIAAFEEVNEILRLLTMHLGPNAVLVNAEIHVVDGLDTDQIEELIEQMTHAIQDEMPEANQVFIELRPAKQPGPE
jgi:cation diffusion facilitator family transporter